jgi:SPX domain protein involved in polyphosphate accumulation
VISELDLSTSRHELKFTTKSSEIDHLKTWLVCHPTGFSTEYQPRTVNSIYFDNFDLDSFQENLSGTSSRAKVRLRWYGDTRDPKTAVLELKLKRNMLGWKITDQVNFKSLKLSKMCWPELFKLLKQQIKPDLAFHLALNTFPVIMVRYQRDYFLSQNKKYRATIDKNIIFYDQRMMSIMNKSQRSATLDTVVLEIKFPSQYVNEAEVIVNDMYLRRARHSKYVTGVSLILGY